MRANQLEQPSRQGSPHHREGTGELRRSHLRIEGGARGRRAELAEFTRAGALEVYALVAANAPFSSEIRRRYPAVAFPPRAARLRHAAFFVASLPVPAHSGHFSTMRCLWMGAGT